MQTPHDTLVQSVLRYPALAAAWVRHVLPARLRSMIDWTTFAPANGRLTGLRLRSHHADLVFTARLRNQAVWVVFVIEHKGHRDRRLQPQLLRYVVYVHDLQHRQQPVEAPFVLALVLHHGGQPPAPPAALPRGLRRLFSPFQPRLRPLVHDLRLAGEAALRRSGLPPALVLTFLFLQHTRGCTPAELLLRIDRWGDLLRAIEAAPGPPAAIDLLDWLGWYLVDTTELLEEQVQMSFARNLQHSEGLPMTTGQRIRQESRELGRIEGRAEGQLQGRIQGRTEGRQEGRNEGQARALLRLLERRFGPLPAAVIERVTNGSAAELDRWTDRCLDVAAPEQLFAD
ncbi:MAG: Rpn family recombination-promoting nuclease/putative transposase [Planctomycetes bacterium]|jgi:hypothetical protein|nr:Rpn family recombination-promoting nuclease/putative transposase [Planctomycetota bacterium]